MPSATIRRVLVPLAFDKALHQLRCRLTEAGIGVVDEVVLSDRAQFRSTLLMVDCTLLLFEALALERSAAALMPVHLVLTGDAHSAAVRWCEPNGAPACPGGTCHHAMEALCRRISHAVTGVARPRR